MFDVYVFSLLSHYSCNHCLYSSVKRVPFLHVRSSSILQFIDAKKICISPIIGRTRLEVEPLVLTFSHCASKFALDKIRRHPPATFRIYCVYICMSDCQFHKIPKVSHISIVSCKPFLDMTFHVKRCDL